MRRFAMLALCLLASCKAPPPPSHAPRFGLVTVLADLKRPMGLAITSDGIYLATDRGLLLMGPEGQPRLLAATGPNLKGPSGVAVATGSVFIADPPTNRIWRMVGENAPEPFAGTGTSLVPIGDGDLAISAQLAAPADVKLDASGDVLIVDTDHQRLRRVDPEGRITTLAGDGQARDAGDGQAARKASFDRPSAIALAPDGSLYLVDAGSHSVRRISPKGIVSTVAGNGKDAFANDGALAARSPLSSPSGIVVLATGLLISEAGSHRIRFVGADGRLATVAGSGAAGTTDETADATSAALEAPGALALAPDGSPFFVDAAAGRLYQLRPMATPSINP